MKLAWGIRARVTLAAVVPMLVLALLLTVFFTSSRLADLDEAHAARGRALARQLAAASEYAAFIDNRDTLQQLASAVLAESDIVAVSVVDPRGHLLARAVRQQYSPPAASEMLRMIEPIEPSKLAFESDFPLNSAQAQAPLASLGSVVIDLSRERLKAERNELLKLAMLGVLLVLLATVPLATWLSRGVSGPIRSVARSVSRIGQGRLSERVPDMGGGSLKMLSDGVNDMAARLQEMHDNMARRILEATAELRARKEEAEQANLAKSRFLAAASHDLRQPMHALGLFISELAQHAHRPEVGRLVERIAASAEAMENLLDSLLDISKLDAGVLRPQVRPFALQALFERIATEQQASASAKGLRLRVRPTPAWTLSDPVLFERVLSNLLSNAIRYTAQGSILIACRRRRTGLRVEVRDSGVGIAAEAQDIIFQEFVQLDNAERARDKGLGLGLAIVRRLTRLLGHTLSLRSTPGQGSVFALDIPASDVVETPDEDGPERSPADLDEWRVVLIEDDTLARDGMQGLLESWGCEVHAAPSLEEVLALAPPPPQLLISDYRLRDPQASGIEMIAAMRRLWGEHLPAVLISADTDVGTLQAAQAAALPLLHKPVRPARLRALLRRLQNAG